MDLITGRRNTKTTLHLFSRIAHIRRDLLCQIPWNIVFVIQHVLVISNHCLLFMRLLGCLIRKKHCVWLLLSFLATRTAKFLHCSKSVRQYHLENLSSDRELASTHHHHTYWLSILDSHIHSQNLAIIEFFAKVDVITTDDNHQSSFWIAVVSFYYEHQCKVLFGHPTETWARSTLPDWFFIPISYIQSRVAYCEMEVDFGHIIGKENIVVVSPLAIY